jgi:hypothetical protein
MMLSFSDLQARAGRIPGGAVATVAVRPTADSTRPSLTDASPV